jgi:hypothetical protein
MPKQKRALGRPKKNWMKSIRKAMHERNLNKNQWEDRKQWSLGVGQRRKSFETGVTGGRDKTSGECSLGQTIPI